MGVWYEEATRKSQCARCKQIIEAGQRIYQVRKGVYLCEMDGSIAEYEEPEVGDIESGVLEDLKQLPPEASGRTLAQLLISTVKRLDGNDVADRDAAPLIKEVRTILVQLKDQFPSDPEDDDTTKKREARERRMLMEGELDDE